MEKFNGLNADQKRQATAAFGGYSYQLWHSVYQWTCLGKDDVLFLEGAEDFDKLSPSRSDTCQVRATKAPITLGAREAIDAMEHFLEHQENNINKKIYYRYLTTSKRGLERGGCFDGKSGLDYWDACKNSDKSIDPIISFLRSKDNLPKRLKDLIELGDNGKLRKCFIERIEWDTDAPAVDHVKRLIEDKLVMIGEGYGVLPSESKAVAADLFEIVSKVVSYEHDRSLQRVNLLELFEEKTKKVVSRSQYSKAELFETALQNGIWEGGKIDNIFRTDQGLLQKADAIPLPDRMAKRQTMVHLLRARIQNCFLMVLRGTDSMGKSTMAKLIIESELRGWKWLSLQGDDSKIVKNKLATIATAIGLENRNSGLVLDNLNFDKDTGVYAEKLIELLLAAQLNYCKIIITSHQDLPSRVASYFPQDSIESIVLTGLDIIEVKELLLNHGCSVGSQLEFWAPIIMVQTAGHPALTHAVARKRSFSGWGTSDPIIAMVNSEIGDVQREAELRLAEQYTSHDARRLAKLLSIFLVPFRRDHAIGLAKKYTEISEAGLAFDQLEGPWLSPVATEYFRVSPLIVQSATRNLTSEERKQLHFYAAEVLLSCDRLTLNEASGIIKHGILGEAEKPLMKALISLQQADPENWPNIVSEIGWLCYCSAERERPIFPKNPIISLIIRELQFQVAAHISPEEIAPNVADIWEFEINHILDTRLKEYFRMLFIVKTLSRFEVPFKLEELVRRVVELIHMADSELFQTEKTQGEILSPIPAEDLLIMIAPRLKSTEAFELFLNEISRQNDADKALLWPVMDNEKFHVGSFLSNIWLNENDKPNPDWKRCIAAYQNAATLARATGSYRFAERAYANIATIQDEYLDEPSLALNTISNAASAVGGWSPALLDRKAMIHFRKDEYASALEDWEKVIEQSTLVDSISIIFIVGKAIHCAGALGEWKKIVELSKIGDKKASSSNLREKLGWSLGFRSEKAYAYWRVGEKEEALAEYVSLVKEFRGIQDLKSNLRVYSVFRCVGHTLSILGKEPSEIPQNSTPQPGWMVRAGIDSEILKNPTQADLLLSMPIFLAMLEYDNVSGDEIFRNIELTIDSITDPYLRLQAEKIRLGHVFRRRSFNDLVKFYYSHAKWQTIFVTLFGNSDKISYVSSTPDHMLNIQPNDSDVLRIFDALLAAIIILVSNKQEYDGLLAAWRQNLLLIMEQTDLTEKWFSLIKQKSEMSITELSNIMENVESSTYIRLVASIRVLLHEDVNPDLAFYSNFLLFDYYIRCDGPWKQYLAKPMEIITDGIWSRLIVSKAFLFPHPQLTVKAIEDACQLPSNGFNKTADILLAARSSTKRKIQNELIQRLIGYSSTTSL